MERRFEVRLERLMHDAVLNPEVFRGMLGRLERFVDPFVERLKRCEQRQHAWEYVAGLLSDVERKNAESIAYHHDQDRQPLQKFLGQLPWDDGPLLTELTRLRTRHQLALEMLAQRGAMLPHAWIAGDDEMGRSSAFRRDLRGLEERYLLNVPSNTLVRDLDAPPPPYGGRGRYPKNPFTRVDRWCAALPPNAWTTIEVRDGEKGPLVVEGVKARVLAKTKRGPDASEEVLVIFRERQEDGTIKHDYCLSNGPWDTPLSEFARVAKAEHRVEECLQRAKSEAGLADYQVRTWIGWHHHQTLSLIAAWFLTQEKRRGEKIHSRDHRASRSFDHSLVAA